MCVVLPALALAASVAGGAMSAYGKSQEGKAAQAQAEGQATALETTAGKYAEVGGRNIREMMRVARQNVSASRVAAAKSGVRPGVGSAGGAERRIVADTRRNATAYGEDIAEEIRQLNLQAYHLRKSGGKMRQAGSIASLGQGISTFGSAASMASKFNWDEFFGKTEA